MISTTLMPCLVARNWPLNWLFGIGNPNSTVWMSFVFVCRIGNQFRGHPHPQPTYPPLNSEVWTSVFTNRFARGASLALVSTRRPRRSTSICRRRHAGKLRRPLSVPYLLSLRRPSAAPGLPSSPPPLLPGCPLRGGTLTLGLNGGGWWFHGD
jgi:hypothetical protein